jgi:hypothetical protein
MSTVNEFIETPIAKAERGPGHVFQGPACEPIATTKLLSWGHVGSQRLNSTEAEDMHFLPKPTNQRKNLLAFVLIAASILLPVGAVKASSAIHGWLARRHQAEMQAKAEVVAKAQAQILASTQAAAQTAAEQRSAAIAKAPAVLATLVAKGISDTSLPATPAASLFTRESFATWTTTYRGIDAGKPPDFVEQMTVAGTWTKPVQYKTIMPHTIVVTAIVDVAGVRKVWLGLMQDNIPGSTAQPHYIGSVTAVPGVDASQLYVAPEVATAQFAQIHDAFGASLAN